MQISIKERFKHIVESLTFILSILLFLSFFGNYFHVFELLTHFTFQYVFLFLMSFVFFALCKDKKWISISCIGLFICLIDVIPWYLPSNNLVKTHKMDVFIANVNTANYNYQKVIEQIKNKDAQIVGLVEVSIIWLDKIKEIESIYPYHYKYPRGDNFGLALYSKHPILDPSIVFFGKSMAPSIVATIKHKKDLKFILTHTLPPISKNYAKRRNDHLKDMAKYSKDKLKLIIGGDFNLTMYSKDYKNFISTSGLKNSRKGFGILPSWGPFLLSIPIDHLLTSKDFNTNKIEILEDNGSDHYPVYAKLSYN
ncbi:MAG: hypothetical protein COB02_07245 [Candidatus Cloacimonadota bacterium]|nr:MAG: hypothetical protein COB02_07245 [Candidatus Cloacimonadota bacterium]